MNLMVPGQVSGIEFKVRCTYEPQSIFPAAQLYQVQLQGRHVPSVP
jgi:hypothetical protein